MPESVMPEYVTPETVPVAPYTVLIRTPFCEFETEEDAKVTLLTVLSERPPTEPMERPCPPVHESPVK
jgi:hypothetical protein